MASTSTFRIYALLAACVLTCIFVPARAQVSPPASNPPDTSRYPIHDRYGDPYTYPNRNTFDLKDTAFVRRNIEYDPVTRQYFVVEKIGNRYYRTPTVLTYQEFIRLQGRKDEVDYFRQRASLLSDLNRRTYRPKFGFNKNWVNRITGNGKVSINPTGYVDIAAGYQGQNIKNPTLPERARKTGGLDFNMNAQFQVDANIGDKIKLPINYNTLANFEFENQLKLDYHGDDDEILKEFQMGNVNFATKGTLIQGSQSLFGIKTQLQFGRLYMTTVLASQRSTKQSLGLQGGSATQSFDLRADEYEENRHFLLAQYFRDNYNNAMSELPKVKSNIQILRVEVWVTNRTGITTDTRDIVALMDLGEKAPFNPFWLVPGTNLPDNNANSLYQTIKNNPNARNSTQAQSVLTGLGGMQPVQDFEKTFARKLRVDEYYFNSQIGFLSLNQPLQPDEVLGVAFQYTYNGKVYQVGEFSQDIPPDSTANSTKVLFLKMLKATSQRPNLPIWDLMMKNVYSVGFGQLEREDFRLDVVYEEPSQGNKRYLPVSKTAPGIAQGTPILTLVNLDRLNNQNDPQPDGLFDYLEGFTVISNQSRVIFPVLEPFGRDLAYAVNDPGILFFPLYDTIKAIAQNYANLNRFRLVGRSKSTSNSDYQLGFNIPRGSVTVTAGGRVLQENVDYEINYDLGTLRVINPAILQAGLPVQVQYENNGTFGLQQRSYMGIRFDYILNKHLAFGATMVQLSERPFFSKQSYNEDPIKNKMYGLDVAYNNNAPRLTKWLNYLPGYSTKAMSSITAEAEAAVLIPGHPKQINASKSDGGGVIYIDDFEGARSNIDLRFPLISWTLASVPQKSPSGQNGLGPELFPESNLNNNRLSGINRARFAWYNIEQVLQEKRNTNNPLRNNIAELIKPETRQIFQTEIFPKRTNDIGQAILTTFDMAYYPKERGPYNFRANNLNTDGSLATPKSSWGGIMRNIDQTDFETSNIEFIEFWLQDPFISNRNTATGGELYFDIGNISEDILRDGKRLYENGLPTAGNPNIAVDTNTVWGKVPRNPQQVTNAFSNDPADRPFQDVGYDGLTDEEERVKFKNYLDAIGNLYGFNSPIYQQAFEDPAGDNFKGYRDGDFSAGNGILERYKKFNNPHGNSPVATQGDALNNAFTLYPDQEDLNRDNTMNEVEEYFQYRVHLEKGMNLSNNPYITDIRNVDARLADGSTRKENWYLFRIPIKDFQAKVGNIPDFKSIRFIRMFMTNFEDTMVLRMGKLELVRNQWRKFNYEVDHTGGQTPLPTVDPVKTDVLAVNIEENDQRQPIPYRTPPGIERQQQLSNNNVQLLQNEQSLSLRACSLPKLRSRGVFKTMNLDLRNYGRLSMFIHAESTDITSGGTDLADKDIEAVIRIGNDFVSNYYEITIPLKISRWNVTTLDNIWPDVNNLDLDLNDLVNLKIRRNASPTSPAQFYSELQASGKTYGLIGNPNLGEIRGMFMGVRLVGKENACFEAWFNELRLSKLNERGGLAANSRVDIRLADLGNVALNLAAQGIGYGQIEQKVNERSKENRLQYDLATNLDLGKLTPKNIMQIPVTAGISKTISKPQFDPYDLDVLLRQKLAAAPGPKQADSIRRDAIDETTIKSVTFTNVKKNKTGTKPPKLYDISNLDFNYSLVHQTRTSPIIDLEDVKKTRAGIGYNFQTQPKFMEPLKKIVKGKSAWLALIRDFNFNYRPSVITLKADVFRQFGTYRPRNVGTSFKLPETFNKYFTFDRYYSLRWEFTRSLTFDFNAVNYARVDEPFGRIDTKQEKDSVRRNFWKGGRNTHYHHEGTFSYALPLSKLPLLDWTTLNLSYTTRYDWFAGTLLDRELGNTLDIGQTRNATGNLDFENLYRKSKFLRAIYADNVEKQRDQKAAALRDTASKVKKPKNPNELTYISPVPKFFGRMVTSLKRIQIQYNEDLGTLLPGYLDSTRVLGMNLKSGYPGWRYVLGYQPDTTDINTFGRRGLLSRDSLFNALIKQRYTQTISITAQVQPIRDLNVDITFERSYDKNYSELYKDTTGHSGLSRLNPYATGSFRMSYLSYQTLFEKFDPETVSDAFKQFELNRAVLSKRLGENNPYQGGVVDPTTGYYAGYGRYAQDVLIPAFLAAYTKKDPTSIQLIRNNNPKIRSNPFAHFVPKPNWNITYSGLSRMKGLDKVFTNFTLRHGYTSELSMNSFTTALLFRDIFHAGFPSFIDPATGNYVPYFLVPNVTISEQFNPLIGVDATFTNQIAARFEYKKSRTLSLSLVDYQLAETQSTEYTIGADWRRKGFPFLQNVKFGKKQTKLDNDVTIRLDFSLRDDATSNSKLDQKATIPVSGQKVVRLAPSIDYVVNNRVNLKFYFEQNRVIPKVATTAPITTTRAGVQVRISLAQ